MTTSRLFAFAVFMSVAAIVPDKVSAMYMAELGRFVSRDPIGYDGSPWNLYEYVDSSPLDGIDPTGMKRPPYFPSLPTFYTGNVSSSYAEVCCVKKPGTRCEEYLGFSPPYCCVLNCFCKAKTTPGTWNTDKKLLQKLMGRHQGSSCKPWCKIKAGGGSGNYLGEHGCDTLDFNIMNDPEYASSGLSELSCGRMSLGKVFEF